MPPRHFGVGTTSFEHCGPSGKFKYSVSLLRSYTYNTFLQQTTLFDIVFIFEANEA